MEHKIVEFNDLQEKIEHYKHLDKKVVLCYGFFGVLHIGHIRYLKKAREYGDILVVVLRFDDLRGSNNMSYYVSLRAQALAHLDWVDLVAVNENMTLREAIKTLKPNVYARGFESVYTNGRVYQDSEDEKIFKEFGVQYVIVKEDEFSSTDQINRYLSNFTEDVLNYMHSFKQRHTKEDLLSVLEQLNRIKVLVVGDTILDEYHYCDTLGKSSKDPTLVLKYESKDRFAGGVLAVANHVANFAGQVDLVTVLGENNSYENFIVSNLKENIRPNFIFKPNAPTLIKKRFIDGYSMHKLFEVYIIDDSSPGQEQDQSLKNLVRERLTECDLIIVADYGHGMLGKTLIDVIKREAPFLAVNTQSNAGNRGFNTISKYSCADYVSLAEHEIRVETRDLYGRLVPMVTKLSRQMGCRQFVVTLGKKGCMVVDQQGELVQVPSFTTNIVDRVGAGDAFFAATSMLSALNVSNEVLGFMGNVVGSLAVQIMGNQKSINKESVFQYIDALYSRCPI